MARSGAGSPLKKRVAPVSPQVKEKKAPHAMAAAAPTSQVPTTKPKPTATTKPPAPAPTKPTVIATTTTVITSTIATTTEISISASISPSSTDGSQQGAGPITTEPASKSAASPGLIAGIVGGIVVLVVLIAGLLFRVKRKRGREAREAELYQQQTMMNKYSEGSSAIGYGDGSRLSLQQQVYHDSRRQQSQQPEWFAKKSALEYYSQVPPIDELMRQKMEQHEQKEQQQQQHEQWQLQRPGPFSQESNNMTYTSSSPNPFTQYGVPVAARSLPGSNSSAEKIPKGESIPLIPTVHSDHPLTSPQLFANLQPVEPYKQHQYQQPRISTHSSRRATASTFSPTSPPSSPTPSNPFSPHFASATKVNYSLSPTLGSPTTTPVSNNGHLTYTPPPPPPPSQPSPGFYDFLLEDDDLLGTPTTAAVATRPAVSPQVHSPYHPLSDPSSPKAPVSPPPIPRSTRPISVASASSFKLAATEIMGDPSAPAVPALPRNP